MHEIQPPIHTSEFWSISVNVKAVVFLVRKLLDKTESKGGSWSSRMPMSKLQPIAGNMA